MLHPLQTRGWDEAREQLCTVLRLAKEYLELKIEKLKYEKELRGGKYK